METTERPRFTDNQIRKAVKAHTGYIQKVGSFKNLAEWFHTLGYKSIDDLERMLDQERTFLYRIGRTYYITGA